MEKEDFQWYQELIRQDFSACELTAEEEEKVIKGAILAAEKMKCFVCETFSFDDSRDLAAKLDLTVLEQKSASHEFFSYFGLYLPKERKIILNLEAIQRTQDFIQKDVPEPRALSSILLEIVCYHEIFHALEERFPSIYTRSQMIHRKRLGMFPYRRGLDSASEIGAVHFSKQMLSLSYSPCIYGEYLRKSSVLSDQ